MSFKYTVKAGDTKSSLRKKYGLKYSFEGYKSKDPNKLFAGEILSIPKQNIQADPIIQNDNIDVSKVAVGRKPVPETIIEPPVEKTQEPFKAMTQDEWLQQMVETDPEKATKIMDALGYTNGPTTTVDKNANVQTATDTLSAIQEEINTLGKQMADKQERKVTGYEESGVFDDMRRLTELKQKLSTAKDEFFIAQDREIEIPIEQRQKFRAAGVTATKTDFEKATRQDLEGAALSSLTRGREYSRLGGAVKDFAEAVQTNINIINEKEDAIYNKYKFEYDKKVAMYDKLEKRHYDIMTNKQKAALEEQKFQQKLFLQDRQADVDIRKDAMSEIIKRGGIGTGELDKLSNMSTSDLLSYQYTSSSFNPVNWDKLSPDQVMNLDKNTRENYKVYMTQSKEDKAEVRKRTSMKSDMVITVEKIDDMLKNLTGLEDSVGSLWGNRNLNLLGAGKVADFRASAKSMISAQTLDTLKNLKATGATMGALSEKELNILINAYNDLGAVFDGEEVTGRFNISEKTFKNRISRIQGAAMRQYLSAELSDTEYTGNDYDNMSGEALRAAYDFVKENGGPERQKLKQQEKVEGVSKAMEAVGQIESGGNYQALGPVVPSGLYKGQQALGKYQIMPGNIPSWAKEAGFELIPSVEEFMKNPNIQDRIAAFQFLKNYEKYDDWNDVASVWFSGRPVKSNLASDVTGTSVPEYVARFNKYFN